MGEKSYLKGYAKALDPDVRTKHKSKSWLRGFIDAHEQRCGSSRGCNKKPSIFSNGCGKKRTSSCDKNHHNYPNKPMDNNMMYMFNNIINKLISLIQSFSSQPLNTYNNYNQYNTYPTTNNNMYKTFNTTYDNDIYNIVNDNDIINTNVNGIGNSVYADA